LDWPFNALMQEPSRESHNRIVPSAEPVIAQCSDAHFATVIGPLCPFKTCEHVNLFESQALPFDLYLPTIYMVILNVCQLYQVLKQVE